VEIYPNSWPRTDLPHGTIGSIGNFDGLHLGQRNVLDMVVARARETGLLPVAISFRPHPASVLAPEHAPPMLTTAAQKAELLEEVGIEALIEVAFTPDFSLTPARRFVRELLHQKLGMSEIYVGSGFTFGHRREGDLSLLRAMGRDFGFSAFAVDIVEHDGRPVSSTRIRAAVAEGAVEEASRMLGRPYALSGIVVRGAQRGRTLGWPTINLAAENELLPADGVYVAEVRLEGESKSSPRPTVVNVGRRPTFEDEMRRVVEGHILDYQGDLYGTRAVLGLRRRLRGERTFAGAEELKRQIALDAEATREYFRVESCCSDSERT
jgi:riboflavin kinase/FMN adenylyltransferase